LTSCCCASWKQRVKATTDTLFLSRRSVRVRTPFTRV